MALSLSNLLYICSIFMLVSIVDAEIRTFDFEIGWVRKNPDGLQERPVIGINGQWPIPRIEATVGDRLIVNVKNQLGNQSTSLHFHGLFMNGSNHMDGVVGVTQCGIPPGSSFTYNFTVDQAGTYWYHSHNMGQYPDGIRGPMIIHDPKSPFAGQYDEELVLTLPDWYHDQMPPLIKHFISVANPTGAEPIPKSALMNDTQNLQISIEPGKTYLIRLVNMAAFAAQYFWIEDHPFSIVEVDGVWTEPAEADMLYISAAQRYSILLATRNDTLSNFAINGAMDTSMFDKVPDTLNPNVTSFLVYNTTLPMPIPRHVDHYGPYDDMYLIPYDREELYDSVGQSIVLDLKMDILGNGANFAFFNNITYVRPKVPSLYTALTTGDIAANAAIYGVNTNSFVLGHNDVIEIILNNHDPGTHPFHLHGHTFQAVARGAAESGDYDPMSANLATVPMRRDTIVVHPHGHIVMRFRSDNPGIWLFHCHIEWHVDSGLIATMVEAPLELQKSLTIPKDHYAACAAQHPAVPTQGNAAAKTTDLLDLRGAHVSPKPLPAGFTGRGIVALVFSCLSAVLGLSAVAWYGVGDLGSKEMENVKKRIAQQAGVPGILEPSTETPVAEGKGTETTGCSVVAGRTL